MGGVDFPVGSLTLRFDCSIDAGKAGRVADESHRARKLRQYVEMSGTQYARIGDWPCLTGSMLRDAQRGLGQRRTSQRAQEDMEAAGGSTRAAQLCVATKQRL